MTTILIKIKLDDPNLADTVVQNCDTHWTAGYELKSTIQSEALNSVILIFQKRCGT